MARIKYFDKYTSQAKFHSDTLDDQFFITWYQKLAPDPTTEESNWLISEASCIFHLLSHKDCPNSIRDIYKVHKRVDRRNIALLRGSEQYIYDNIDLILSGSRSTREMFLYRLTKQIGTGSFCYDKITPQQLISLLGLPSALPLVKGLNRVVEQDYVLNLLDNDNHVRGFAKWYQQLNDQDKNNISLVVRALTKLKLTEYDWDYYQKIEFLKTLIDARINYSQSVIILATNWGLNLHKFMEDLTEQDYQTLSNWISALHLPKNQQPLQIIFPKGR